MGVLDRIIAGISPGLALSRARSRAALGQVMRYDAARVSDRTNSLRARAGSADTAGAGDRTRLAYVARDIVRNTAFALRAQTVIVNNVIGDGIIWKVAGGSDARVKDLARDMKRHLDSVGIDADGRQNLFGLERLALNTVVESGEVLVRRVRGGPSRTIPMQIQVLEPDYLDASRDGVRGGNEVREGIEYDPAGRRVAYWLYDKHPGEWRSLTRATMESRRVPASEVLHIYRQDRPGQMRGVSWFAPIALQLQDLADHQEAQLLRQKIAACFSAFHIGGEGTETVDSLSSLSPGRIQHLGPDEDIKFAEPPGVSGYEEFSRSVLRAVAAGMGLTYEALTGDLSGVNFSSARMGRLEMDRNVSSWQWVMMIPQLLQPLSEWVLESWEIAQGKPRRTLRIEWVPPARFIVDPAREIPALITKIQGGLASRQGVVRELGFDPDELLDEQEQDASEAKKRGLMFTSDVALAPEPEKGTDDAPDHIARAIAAMPAPQFNMAAPQVTVEATQVHVTPPSVTVEAPQVTIHAHIPRRGAVQKDAVFDDNGRMIGMTEREIEE